MKNEPAQNLEMKDFSLAVGTMPLILDGPSALPAGGLSSGYLNFAPCGSARQFGERSHEAIVPSSTKACIGGESILVPHSSLRRSPTTRSKFGCCDHAR
jgi:hypothetical protein